MFVTRSYSVAVGLWTVFFVNGAVLASWAPRIPEVRDLLGLSDSELGTALFGVAAGSVPALLLTARFLNHVRPGRVCAVAAVVFSASLPLIGVAGGLWQLTATLALLGAASGVLDVAMNTFAITYQERTGTRVLSRLHGGYSLGTVAGATGGVAATRVGATVTGHLVVVAILLCVAALACAPALWPQPHGTVERRRGATRVAPRAGRRGVPLTVAVLAVCGLIVEGLVTDWSALLITRDLDASSPLAASALALFSLAMFISRSAGDAVLNRFGEPRTLTSIGVVVAGLALAGFLLAQPVAMVMAVAVTGLALGPVFPVAVYRASRSAPGRAAAMTARVSAIGYLAYLGGPPVIGLVAEAVGLPVTFAVVILLSCLGIVLARREPAPVAPSGGFRDMPAPR